MVRKGTNSKLSAVAIEIRHDSLVMATLDPAGKDSPQRVRTRSIRWRHEATSLRSEQGRQELLKAFKTLAEEEELAGASVGLTFSGEYSICRIVIGGSDLVRRELVSLEERKELYLSLGPEEKASAQCIQELDARHQHAVLAVANVKTLDIATQAAAAVGMEVSLVEPALVALSRALGAAGADADEPALIVDLSDGGIKLGISCRGQLLLDYRPVGGSTVDQIDKMLVPHLARLQRYCDRNYHYVRGSLKQVYLCGSREDAASAASLLEKQEQLTVKVLDPSQVDSRWDLSETDAGPECCAALGTCLRLSASSLSTAGPNLVERRRAEAPRPVFADACRTFWPVAVVVLIACGLFGAAWYERMKCHGLERDIEVVESAAAELQALRREIGDAEAKSRCVRAIAEESAVPPWDEILTKVANCMPEDVWLEKIVADSQGKVALTGNSFREGTIYQFGQYLESSPEWSYVTVEGTWPASTRVGRTTKFDIQGEFNDPETGRKEAERSD